LGMVGAAGGRLLGLLGGPAGLALTIGAVGWSLVDFSPKASSATQSTAEFAEEIAHLTGNFKELQAQKIDKDLSAIEDKIKQVTTSISERIAAAGKSGGMGNADRQFVQEMQGRLATLGSAWQEVAKKRQTALDGNKAGRQDSETTVSQKVENDYKRRLDSMKEQIALYGETSEAAKINFAIISGSLGRLSAQQKSALLDKAKELDLLRQETESAAYLAALQDKIASRKAQVQQGVAEIGMGDRARQEMEEILAIQQEYAQRQEQMARAQGGPSALPDAVYNQRLQQMRSAMEQETQIVRDGQAAQLAARREGFNGVTSAWSNYLASASDVAGQMDALFTNAFRNAEDALVQFVKTGELDLRTLADAVLTDVIRMLIRMGIQMAANAVISKTMAGAAAAGYVAQISGQAGAQVAMAGLNTFASIAAIPVVGPAAAPGAAAAAIAAAAPMGFSAIAAASSSLAGMAHSGIDNVPTEGTWLLDKGERVLSPRQNRDLTDFMGRGGRAGGGHVTIINQTAGRIDKVEERTGAAGERVIIIQEAVNAVAAAMKDPNSRVSRSMQGGFSVQRKR
ncbi:MAG: phage tail tape measure C-terminal domain-containing protein, partial [Moraxellaceae bacterium]